MLDSTTTMFVFLGAMVASQLIGRRALNALTPEQKLALMESSPKVPWTLIFIAVAYGIQSLFTWIVIRYPQGCSNPGLDDVNPLGLKEPMSFILETV